MNGTTIAGTGIVPEGLFQNEIIYDFALQQGYLKKVLTIKNLFQILVMKEKWGKQRIL